LTYFFFAPLIIYQFEYSKEDFLDTSLDDDASKNAAFAEVDVLSWRTNVGSFLFALTLDVINEAFFGSSFRFGVFLHLASFCQNYDLI
jgi:hypothetical protein